MRCSALRAFIASAYWLVVGRSPIPPVACRLGGSDSVCLTISPLLPGRSLICIQSWIIPSVFPSIRLPHLALSHIPRSLNNSCFSLVFAMSRFISMHTPVQPRWRLSVDEMLCTTCLHCLGISVSRWSLTNASLPSLELTYFWPLLPSHHLHHANRTSAQLSTAKLTDGAPELSPHSVLSPQSSSSACNITL